MKMERIPLISIKSGNILKKQPNSCHLVLQDNDVPMLDFVCVDEEVGKLYKLHCENITAVDLRVETKFGCIDEMKGFLLVECSNLESRIHNTRKTSSNDEDECFTGYGLVHATFQLEQATNVRDVLQNLRRKHQNLVSARSNIAGKMRKTIPPTQLQEGLPTWVQYIPHNLYSKHTRQCVKSAINIYFVFSFLWAIWQLYRNVDFVRELVNPLWDTIQRHYKTLDYTIHVINTMFEEFTVQWLCFLKPLHTVILPITTPLWKMFANFYWILRPVITLVFYVIKTIKTASVRMRFLLLDNALLVIIGRYLRTTKEAIVTLLNGLGNTQLDPFKAQFILIRSIVVQSGKAVVLGVFRFLRKVYSIIWIRKNTGIKKKQE